MSQLVDHDPFSAAELETVIASTEAQKEIWAAARLGNDASCAYNESISLTLHAALDEPALRRALQKLVDRHEALRGTFAPDDGRLCLAATMTLGMETEDLAGLQDDTARQRLQTVRTEEVETPFDLENGPLFRARLFRLGPMEHSLILTAHHIICDGWSMAVLLRDLGLLYSLEVGRPQRAVPSPNPFTGYASRVAQQAGSETYRQAENYWLERFQGDIPVLDLPLDHARPPLKSFAADRYDHVLGPELVQALKQRGAKAGASFFTLLLGSFAVFLHRLTGQRDLVIGVPAAGQSATGMENVVGHCANLLPIRCKVDPAGTFAAFLQDVRIQVLDAYDHQQITFGQLLRKLPLPRDPSRNPLVSVSFNLDQAVQGKDLKFVGLDVEVATNPRHFENFELFINAAEAGGKVVLECQYNTDLFERDTIRDRMESFEALLVGIVADPQQPVARLPMLSTAQQQKILVDWNATALDYPRHQTVHQLISDQAQRTPDRPALVFGAASLTYADLEKRANRLAHHLIRHGTGRDMLVGLCLERSLDMVVGLLAILKAGAGYVPLDPSYPRDRLAYMLTDSQAGLVLTQEKCLSLLPVDNLKVICVDRDSEALALQPATVPQVCVQAGDIAYVIYTSGSTGKPKGVAVRHGNVVNFLTATRATPGIQDSDVLLAVTTLSFDIAVMELLLPLTVGAKVVLADQETASDGHRLLEMFDQHGVTILQATPSTWRLLLQAGWKKTPRLTAWCGGEAMRRDLAAALLERVGELWNLYGPTETTVWSTAFQIVDLAQIRIGKPLGNTQVYLLDANLEPVPVGVAGELYLSGAGVARGYLHRPELTAERFVENPYHDPFADYLNPAMYRTGDLARWHSDGTIEYLGRNDHQVKLRGFRIELGEIETALATHPGVGQAVVMVREDRPGDPRLVAYMVPRPEQSATVTELRRFLRGHLPEYMIPQHVVELDQLPLTNNGKIDRKRLPPPFAVNALPLEEVVAAKTSSEKYLARVCQEALGLASVGMNQNFFNLGGHSLLAFQVLARLEKDTGLRLSPRTFVTSTLAQVAEQLPPHKVPAENSPAESATLLRPGVFGKIRGWFGN